MRTSLFIPISEILLKFIRIVRSVIGCAWKFTILRLAVKIGIRACRYKNGFYLLVVIPIRDFGETTEVIFEWEFIDNYELSSDIFE